MMIFNTILEVFQDVTYFIIQLFGYTAIVLLILIGAFLLLAMTTKIEWIDGEDK